MVVVRLQHLEWGCGRGIDGVDPDGAVGGAEREGVGVGGGGAGGEPVNLLDFLGFGEEGGDGWRCERVGWEGVGAETAVETGGAEIGAEGEGEGQGVDGVGVAG